jgi:hypothetical protein
VSRLMPRSIATVVMGAMIGKKFAGRALASGPSTKSLAR